MALWRAVWVIQARGRSGTPDIWPLLQGSRKCFLRILFGQIEIAQQPDQRGHNPAPIGAIDLFHGCGGIRVCRHARLYVFFGIDVDLEGRRSTYL